MSWLASNIGDKDDHHSDHHDKADDHDDNNGADGDQCGQTKTDRERYVSGTCALDLVHEVPQETFVRVLRSMRIMMKKIEITITLICNDL